MSSKNSVAVPITLTVVAGRHRRRRRLREDEHAVHRGRPRTADANRRWEEPVPFAVTMPVVATNWPVRRERAAALNLAESSAWVAVQLFAGVAELRGAGPAATEKSTSLLLESIQPPRLRSAAVVLVAGSIGLVASDMSPWRRSPQGPRCWTPDHGHGDRSRCFLQRDLASDVGPPKLPPRRRRQRRRPAGTLPLLNQEIAPRRDGAGQRRHLPWARTRRGSVYHRPTGNVDGRSCRD